MKCKSCLIDKGLEDFPVRKDRSNRLRPYCKDCAKDIQKSRYKVHKRDQYFKHKCSRSRSRSQSLKIPFDLTPEYLENLWTGICPVSGLLLKKDTDRLDEAAAELDRIVPEKGYIKGNVCFLSRKINRIKNNAKIEELERLVEWLKLKLHT